MVKKNVTYELKTNEFTVTQSDHVYLSLPHLLKLLNSTDEIGTGGEYLHCSGSGTNAVHLQR